MKNTAFYPTLLGLIGITEINDKITRLFLGKDPMFDDEIRQETPLLKEAASQVAAYLTGKLHCFDLPLAPQGTPFQQTVWTALRKIPYGETRSYKQLAEAIGQPGAFRAVGGANHQNPILIITPCHRVIGANGKLVGYAAGLAIKETLLALEQRQVRG